MSAHGLLSPRDVALVEAVAVRVVELLDQRAEAPSTGLVDAQTLARLLGVSRSTVYEHAAELGAVEVGGGSQAGHRRDKATGSSDGPQARPRPRLRFDPQEALEAWNRRYESERSQVPQSPSGAGALHRRRPGRLGSGGRLLPVKGQSDGRTQA